MALILIATLLVLLFVLPVLIMLFVWGVEEAEVHAGRGHTETRPRSPQP